MTNIVNLAVASRMKGDADAPIVPHMLTHPKLKELTSIGKSYATKTKNTPQVELKTNLRKASKNI
jgi:hypothetical protein